MQRDVTPETQISISLLEKITPHPLTHWPTEGEERLCMVVVRTRSGKTMCGLPLEPYLVREDGVL